MVDYLLFCFSFVETSSNKTDVSRSFVEVNQTRCLQMLRSYSFPGKKAILKEEDALSDKI